MRTMCNGSTRFEVGQTMEMAPGGRAEELIARVDGELRHPMSTLLAASQTLVEELPAEHPSAGLARLVLRESLRVQETLTDLVTMGLPVQMHSRGFDAGMVLADVCRNAAVESHRAKVAAEIPSQPARAWGDPEAIALALRKIVHHQLSAMPCGGVLAARLHNEVGCVVLDCDDEGPRIPASFSQSYFEPYAMLPGRRTALDMALCRLIVEHLGGAVSARNHETGVRIEVRLRAER